MLCSRYQLIWMIKNKLKLNDDKTELVVISSKHQPRPAIASIQVGEETINHAPTVFCSIKFTQFHLRNIVKIRKYLDEGSTETLVPAFVSSKLDYSNSLLYVLPKCLINRLQLIYTPYSMV